jgi:hypothetical protein
MAHQTFRLINYKVQDRPAVNPCTYNRSVDYRVAHGYVQPSG